MDKRSLSERDICTKYITPALKKAGWDIHSQVREEVTLTHGYSTNGRGFVEHDRTGSLGVVEFVVSSGKIPRYDQLLAMNRTVEAITTGWERILLVMAPGTCKTYTAFQKVLRL
nr:DEAD/DEAH box helicase family protein [Desulfovermiculus halophilus]